MYRAQELCESRGGRAGLPVPNSPYGLCGRNATLNLKCHQQNDSCIKMGSDESYFNGDFYIVRGKVTRTASVFFCFVFLSSMSVY